MDSEGRGNIGASQNRFSSAAANLGTTLENITAADSAIRDVDMAAEMTSFTKKASAGIEVIKLATKQYHDL